jgi:hypothetical protein
MHVGLGPPGAGGRLRFYTTDDNMNDYDTNDLPVNSPSEDPLSIQTDMASVMDALQFNEAEIQMPWDAAGNLMALETVVGTPESDAQFWQLQTTPFTCAVVALGTALLLASSALGQSPIGTGVKVGCSICGPSRRILSRGSCAPSGWRGHGLGSSNNHFTA